MGTLICDTLETIFQPRKQGFCQFCADSLDYGLIDMKIQ